MGITNKAISTKFLNIIIRTNHGQTEIVMQYGGLRCSVACVATSCINESFASQTHRTNKSLYKGLWDVVPPVDFVCVEGEGALSSCSLGVYIKGIARAFS